MDDVMHPDAVAAVLDSIPQEGLWKRPLRRDLIMLIGRYPAGVEVSIDSLAVLCRASRSGVRLALKDLGDLRVVIERKAGKKGGRTPNCYRLRGNLRVWKIEWGGDIADVEWQAFHRVPLCELGDLVVARLTTSRPGDSRYRVRSGANSPKRDRDTKEPAKVLWRDFAGGNRDTGETVYRESPGQNGRDRATTQEVVLHGRPAASGSGVPLVVGEGESGVDRRWFGVRRAIARALGAETLWGEAAQRFAELFREHGPDALHTALDRRPACSNWAKLHAWLEDELEEQRHRPKTPAPAPEPAPIHRVVVADELADLPELDAPPMSREEALATGRRRSVPSIDADAVLQAVTYTGQNGKKVLTDDGGRT
jgi:hypothetical protein